MLLNLQSSAGVRGLADKVILSLSPAAWYRNATDVVSSGGFASIWADYASSAKALILPGVTNNWASTPDAAPLNITGSIDLIARVSLPDWAGGAIASYIINKLNSAGNYAYDIQIRADGKLELRISSNGTLIPVDAVSTATVQAASGVADDAALWVRGTYNTATGDVNFYYAADSSSVPSSWSAVGTTVAASATAIFAGTNTLALGTQVGATGQAGARIYRTIIKNGIGGTTVFDADFSSQAIGASTFTESSSNAATVTINTSGASPAHIGKARDLLQGTGTNQPAYSAGVFTFDGVDNFMKTAPFTLNQPTTMVVVGKQVTWQSNDYITDGNATNSLVIQQHTSTPNLNLYAGLFLGLNGNLAVNTRGIICAVVNGASSVLRINNTADATGNAGATNAGGFTLGSNGAGSSGWANIAIEEVVLFPSALSDAQRTSVITALNNALTVF